MRKLLDSYWLKEECIFFMKAKFCKTSANYKAIQFYTENFESSTHTSSSLQLNNFAYFARAKE